MRLMGVGGKAPSSLCVAPLLWVCSRASGAGPRGLWPRDQLSGRSLGVEWRRSWISRAYPTPLPQPIAAPTGKRPQEQWLCCTCVSGHAQVSLWTFLVQNPRKVRTLDRASTLTKVIQHNPVSAGVGGLTRFICFAFVITTRPSPRKCPSDSPSPQRYFLTIVRNNGNPRTLHPVCSTLGDSTPPASHTRRLLTSFL